MQRSSSRRAVTFLDVVVSLAVIALLVAAMVPVLVRSGNINQDQREQRAAKQLTRALTSYATDNNDALVPAHPQWNWVHNTTAPGVPQIHPRDPYNSSRRLVGTIAKTYMSILADGRGITPADMQVDPATAAAFAARSTQPESFSAPNFYEFGVNSAQAGVLWHPSFGYNGVFVGGSFRHGAFSDGPNGLTNNTYGGAFYLQRLTQAVAPSRLIAFATARGGDVANGSWWNFGAAHPNSGTMRPGYYLVTPPRATGMPNGSSWNTTLNTYDASRVPGTWGNLDFRAGNNKAIVAQLDGSNQTLSISALRDMRRWANQATGPNWTWSSGQNAVP